MSRYPNYSYTYSPQPPSLSSFDFYNQFRHHDDDSTSTVHQPKTSPYPSPNPPPYVPGRMTNPSSITKSQTSASVVEDEKATSKTQLQDIPINSPAILHQLPAHYRHNDYECQHGGHRRDGGGFCPYMFPSNASFNRHHDDSEYHHHDTVKDDFDEHDHDKPCHRSARVHCILLPVLVILAIVAGILILNACLVGGTGTALVSWGKWDWKDWKGVPEGWKAGGAMTGYSSDGLVGSDTGVVKGTEALTHGAGNVGVLPQAPGMFPLGTERIGGGAHQIVSHARPVDTPQQPSLDKRTEESGFVKRKLYLVVVFLGLFVVIILAIMLSAWCCKGAFENPCCCPCYLCACCGGLACLECIGCGLCCEGIAEMAED